MLPLWLLIVLMVVLALLVLLILLISISSVTVTLRLKEGKPLRELNLAHMERLKRGLLTVYFSPGCRSLAEEVLSVLEQAWRIARERFTIDFGRLGVALVVPNEGEDLGGVILNRKIWALWDPIWPVLTPPSLQSLQQADRDTLIAIYWAMAHEAMELKVAKKLYHDRRSRWIGDGLAEYMGYAITSELAPQVRDEMLVRRRRSVQGLLDQGHRQYDLTKEFLAIIRIGASKNAQTIAQTLAQKSSTKSDPGYGVALALWLQIAQRHGEGMIKTFWQRISKRGFPNAQEAARILSELTGEDIWTKLQNMDLQEVLATLEAAAGIRVYRS